MTRKDYILIARVLSRIAGRERYQPNFSDEEMKFIIEEFCQELWKDNSNFNADKFKKACGVEEWMMD